MTVSPTARLAGLAHLQAQRHRPLQLDAHREREWAERRLGGEPGLQHAHVRGAREGCDSEPRTGAGAGAGWDARATAAVSLHGLSKLARSLPVPNRIPGQGTYP